ncbi:DinB family protein [Nocardioides albidus]|uniref:DinB family protein n=2 Tax=Nocardioides albidus TaxID=1517589 RepID=A0A5C4VVB3_9ACTN|nr:DinB family protein [Nocardioides albidus]
MVEDSVENSGVDSRIAPDTKDWTWVLERPCPECGFDPAAVERAGLGDAVRDNAAFWATALGDPRAAQRPAPGVWSPVEYACHVRDVNRVFAGRLEQMLTEDDPQFADWDQDETAVTERYDEQRAADVVPDLLAAGERVAAGYDGVRNDAWDRPGRRSNGSLFTVDTIGRYHLHDLVHHRWDVRWIMGE